MLNAAINIDEKDYDWIKEVRHLKSRDGVKDAKPSVAVDFYWAVAPIKEEEKKGGRYFEGYCTTKDIDMADERVTHACMEKVVSMLPGIAVLENHDIDRPVGKIVAALLDDVGIYVKGLVSQTENELWTKVCEGIISKMSIRLRNKKGKVVREGVRQVFEIDDMDVPEVSLTSLPCNLGATIGLAYEKMRDKEGNLMKIDVSKVVETMKEAVKELLAEENTPKAQVLAFMKTHIESLDDEAKTKLTEDGLKAKMDEELSKHTVEDKDALVSEVLTELKNEYGYPAPAAAPAGAYKPEELAGKITTLEKGLSDLVARVEKLEKATKTVAETLPGLISEAIEGGVKDIEQSINALESAQTEVKTRVEGLATKDEVKSVDGRLQTVEKVVPGSKRKKEGEKGEGESFWKGAFPA